MNIRASQKSRELWIGKVEVRPFPNSTILDGGKGAFVNVVTWATDQNEYRQHADLVLGELGLHIVEVENPEPIVIRMEKAVFDEEIEEMIARAQCNPKAIIYGTFHIWDRDTA